MRAVAAVSFVARVVSFLLLFGPVFVWWAQTGDRWKLAIEGRADAVRVLGGHAGAGRGADRVLAEKEVFGHEVLSDEACWY